MAYEEDEFPMGFDFVAASRPKRKCYACDRKLGRNPHPAVTSDGQKVFVGSECYKMISFRGWQPPLGGPRLYKGRFAANGDLVSIVGLPKQVPQEEQDRRRAKKVVQTTAEDRRQEELVRYDERQR